MSTRRLGPHLLPWAAIVTRVFREYPPPDVSTDIDTDPITRGLEAIASGFSLRYPYDEENLSYQFEVYDALYAWCRLQVAKGQ